MRSLLTTAGRVLADDVEWADTAMLRLKGLIGRRNLPPGTALVLVGAHQVHTFGMHFAIDVLFCDEAWTVVHVIRSMGRRRVSRWVKKARYAIELPAGSSSEVSSGDRIVVTDR